MTDLEIQAYVEQCAHALRLGHGATDKPASVNAVTVQPYAPERIVVWIVTLERSLASYRFHFYNRPRAGGLSVIDTVGMSVVDRRGIRNAEIHEIPANVRDLAITAAARAFGTEFTSYVG